MTSTADSGAGSFREAILTSNTTGGTDTITFAISGTGVKTITPLSALPTITDPVVIDGTTQAGYTTSPLVEIRGSSAGGGVIGLNITAGNSTIRGLNINSFGLHGIQLSTNGNNLLQANCIGTTSAGTGKAANLSRGVFIDGSNNNTIGGSTFTNATGAGPFSARNVISGNNSDGVFIQNATGNVLKNNYIGLASSGTAAVGNGGDGVVIGTNSSGNTIGGLTSADRNVISGNTNNGIQITGDNAANNTIVGNYIGLRSDGTAAIANRTNGVRIDGSAGVVNVSANAIGGTAAGSPNIISGNLSDGVTIVGDGVSATVLQGNYIGTNASGTSKVANGNDGVNLIDTNNQTVGGTAAGAGNVISGNGQNGVEIQDDAAAITMRNNIVQGNFIGTNAAGTGALGNGDDGVDLNSSSGNTIGGTTIAARNIIAANASDGVEISVRDFLLIDASFNTVQGNYIGTDVNGSGAASLGNSGNGVHMTFSTTVGATYTVHDNLIGGTTAGARNVISNNGDGGVRMTGPNVFANTVQGNYIGVKPDGVTAFGNGRTGVHLTLANNNTIGGAAAGAANVVAFNGAAATLANVGGGVWVESGTGNVISANSIYSNTTGGIGGLGIDLGAGGVTPNDSGDPDTGANNLQNFPVLTSATSSASATTISGTFNGASSASLTLQFFSNTAAEPSGFGEGRTYLGSTVINTDAGGNTTFNVTLPVATVVGQFVSATATDAANNTSEFSQTVTITAAALQIIGDQDAGNVNDQFRLVRDGGNPTMLDIFVNTTGTPTYSINYASASQITIDALTGDDTLTLDFANGTPIPAAGLIFHGGTSTTASPGDTIIVTGNGADAVTYAPSGSAAGSGTIAVDARSMSFTEAESETVGASASLNVLTPNAADLFTIDSPAAGSNRVSGTSGGVAIAPLSFYDVPSVTMSSGTNDLVGGTADALTIAEPGLVATGLSSFHFVGGAGGDSLTVNGGSFAPDSDLGADTPSLNLAINTDGVGAASAAFGTTQHLASLTIGAGGSAALAAGGGTRVVSVKSLNITGSGRLDLADHNLIVDYTPPAPSPAADVLALIASGRNGGAWDGSGIITSLASGNFTTLGSAEASQAMGIAGTQTALFAGEAVDASTVLVKYSYGGDANLDGKINVDDYGKIDFNVNLGVAGYINGDFNYDGKINVDDYGIIDFNVGIQGPPIGSSPSITAAAATTFAPSLSKPQSSLQPELPDRTVFASIFSTASIL